jgi:hypothetical protein
MLLTSAYLVAAALAAAGLVSAGEKYVEKKNNALNQIDHDYVASESKIREALKSQSFDDYIQDAYSLGFIDSAVHRDALDAYNKVINKEELDKKDKQALTSLYNELYQNDATFRENWNTAYSRLSNEDKLKWIDGATAVNATIPSPAYLDTSFDTYKRDVEPVKIYSNKELAELYNLDFDYENILADYKKAGEAKVDYAKYVSEVAKQMTEQQNGRNVVSYLDAIRANKGEAINKGMTSGAQAAADVNATREAIANKVQSELETGQVRNKSTAQALLENSQAALNATDVYNNLAQVLGNTSVSLYASDSARYGADMLANAGLYGADQNLRGARMAANDLMSAIYSNYAAQGRNVSDGVNNVNWLFKNVYLPANNYNVDSALYDYKRNAWTQNYGYESSATKQGNLNNAIPGK